ncbi:hypothetical protein DRQ25_13495 [Candidatus Fermentibacteria bacterium]|nr:MAG: hypothetical protein DRQ25_13495 [Candidatus Fermentibacteria bacterium]
MPTYKITDNDTGISTQVNGDYPPTTAQQELLFEEFYKEYYAEDYSPETAGANYQQSMIDASVDVGAGLLQMQQNPLDTLGAVGDMAWDASQYAIDKLKDYIPDAIGDYEHPLTDQFIDQVDKDYGTFGRFKRTFENDPAKVGMDAAVVLPVPGAAVGKGIQAGVRATPDLRPPLRAAGEITKRIGGMALTGVVEGTGLGTVARVAGKVHHIAGQTKKKLDKQKASEVEKTEQFYKDKKAQKKAEVDAAYTQNVKAKQAGMTPEEYMNAPAQPTLAERIRARDPIQESIVPPLEPAVPAAPKPLDPKHQAILDQIRNRPPDAKRSAALDQNVINAETAANAPNPGKSAEGKLLSLNNQLAKEDNKFKRIKLEKQIDEQHDIIGGKKPPGVTQMLSGDNMWDILRDTNAVKYKRYQKQFKQELALATSKTEMNEVVAKWSKKLEDTRTSKD